MTKLKVKEIILDHSIEGDEPWPEIEKPASTSEEDDEMDSDDEATTIEWDLKKDDDENQQPRLFEDE